MDNILGDNLLGLSSGMQEGDTPDYHWPSQLANVIKGETTTVNIITLAIK